MTEQESETERPPLALARRLAASMLPLAVLLFATIGLGGPAAFLAFRLRDARNEVTALAERVAALVEREAGEDELLWKYNVPKLLGGLRAHREDPHVAAIEIVDAEGQRLDTGVSTERPRAARDDRLWAAAAIGGGDRRIGEVWVAVHTRHVYRAARPVLVLFALAGAALAWLIYTLPLRSAARAERVIGALLTRLQASRQELASLNESLERRVAARSAELAAACGELRRLSAEAIMLQERERRAIARELHDTVGQALTAVRINLQLIAEQGQDRAEAGRVAARSVALVDEALEDVRRAVSFLGPAILDEIGLAAAVERQCLDFAERTGATVERTIQADGPALSPAVESTCYRVVQEALTNVTKHAAATRVSVSLRTLPDAVRLEIRDDGRGFDAEARVGAGRGLGGIRERVALLGGEVQVDAGPGRGTALRVRLPLK
ncbi:MAG: sensor histidine kinase [Deltaproteobacteria bacterium]|nr:sensor histidine kinase [Deltaproteobacteria bacterium]